MDKIGLKIKSFNKSMKMTIEEYKGNCPTHEIVEKLLDRRLCDQKSDLWHKRRQRDITATDAGVLLNHNPFKSIDDLRMKKIGQGTSDINEACTWGIQHENYAADIYTSITGNEMVKDCGYVHHENYDWIGCSPDGLLKKTPILVEIKSPYRAVIKPGTIKNYYYDQVQFQMEVCNIDECHFVQCKPANLFTDGIIDIQVIKRDKLWWTMSFPAFKKFHEQMLNEEIIDAVVKRTEFDDINATFPCRFDVHYSGVESEFLSIKI